MESDRKRAGEMDMKMVFESPGTQEVTVRIAGGHPEKIILNAGEEYELSA